MGGFTRGHNFVPRFLSCFLDPALAAIRSFRGGVHLLTWAACELPCVSATTPVCGPCIPAVQAPRRPYAVSCERPAREAYRHTPRRPSSIDLPSRFALLPLRAAPGIASTVRTHACARFRGPHRGASCLARVIDVIEDEIGGWRCLTRACGQVPRARNRRCSLGLPARPAAASARASP